jgi:universal stress protein E
MTKKGNILVVVEDGCNPRQTVDRAVLVAGLLNRKLDILYCDESNGGIAGGILVGNEAKAIYEHILELQAACAEELSEPASKAGVLGSVTVLHERPIGDGVMSQALQSDPVLIMKGTQFHSDAQRGILVDADWQLMRSCPYPLWLVNKKCIDDKPVIVAAVDPTHAHDKPAALDQVIVDTAKKIAMLWSAEVHLLHTYQRLAAIGKAANRTINPIKLPIDKIDQKIKQEHRIALDALARKNDFPPDHVHQIPGRTKDILPTFARAGNADLVVMGALARWGIKRMVIGSTAERVMDHLPCDVLVVRDNEYTIDQNV